MSNEQKNKILHNFFIDIYGGFFYKKNNDSVEIFSRKFNEMLFVIQNQELKFKDELLFNSIPQILNLDYDVVNTTITNYFQDKFNLKIKKIIK